MISGCLIREKAAPADLVLDYQINAKEGDDNLSVLLQFRNPINDDAIELKAPEQVRLDGEILMVDSAKKHYFYEAFLPIDSFQGIHEILFTDREKRQFKKEFRFEHFKMNTMIPDSIDRDSLQLEFSGVSEDDQITMILTDTSFVNDDINRVLPEGVSKIVLGPEDLDNLRSGPVRLEFIRETMIYFKNEHFRGGMQINYSLKREFILK